jgi:hypothetical protein
MGLRRERKASFEVLVHARAYRTLRRLVPDHAWFDSVPDCLEDLACGSWTGSRCVKVIGNRDRLPIYEARVNRGDRLLFAKLKGDRLLVLDIVRHDDVGCYRAIGLDRHLVPPCIHGDWLTSLRPPSEDDLAAVDPRDAESSDAHRWRMWADGASVYAPPEAVLCSGDRLREWCTRNDVEADLLLSDEQRNALRLASPCIVIGSAGTGKTTVLVHAMIARAQRIDRPMLYVTFCAKLRDRAQRLYAGLSRRAGQSPALGRFLTYQELCLQLAGRYRNSTSHDPPEVAAVFARWLARLPRTDLSDLGTLLQEDLWAEIRGTLLGRNLDMSTGPLLALDAYSDMSDAMACVPKSFRPNVHRLAHRAVAHLRNDGVDDDQRLARDALRAVLSNPTGLDDRIQFGGLFCDETQDLTRLQVHLLHVLWERLNQCGPDRVPLMLAFDVSQAIYPSLFHPADPTEWLYSRGHRPSEARLGFAFRNHATIAAIARTLHDRRSLMLGSRAGRARRDDTYPVSSPSGGEIATLDEDRDAVLRRLGQRALGPSAVILVRDAPTARQLTDAIGASADHHTAHMVCAIQDYKGLEADTVLLWCLGYREPGPRDPTASTLSSANASELLEANRMIVAVTRAKLRLVLVDEADTIERWQQIGREAGVTIERRSMDWLYRVCPDSAVDWRSKAEEHSDLGRWRLAAVAWERAGEPAQATRCRAEQAEADHDYAEAAHSWALASDWRRAEAAADEAHRTIARHMRLRIRAECLELDGAWEEAAQQWRHAGNSRPAGDEGQRFCRLRELACHLRGLRSSLLVGPAG